MYTEGATVGVKVAATAALVLAAAGRGLYLFAQTEGVNVADYLDLPALGMLAWVIYWLLGSFERTQKETTKTLRDVQKALNYNTVLLIQHTSTVRGESPEHMGTTEDILRRVEGALGDR